MVKNKIIGNWKGRFALISLLVVILAGCAALDSQPTPEIASPPPTVTPTEVKTPAAVAVETQAATQPAPTPTEMAATPSRTPQQPEPVSSFPDPGGYRWSPVLSGLARPTDLTAPAGSAGLIFVVEQAGVIHVARDGQLLPAPFLDIRSRVGSQANEQGLLGLAFHPAYADNGFFFINYTDTGGISVISQWQVSADPDRADADSEQVLLRIPQPYRNHNGGGILFGPDGYLYISLGDGGSGGDPHNHAQNIDTLLGSLLRIDPDLRGGYTIPADNPFRQGEGQPEIWAYGLRNAWRFAFDDLTGDLYIADVGQSALEEINFVPAGTPGGMNFGWNYKEGTRPFRGEPPAGLELVDPVFEYDHSLGCSVTGGHVVRADHLPAWNGIYLFGDYCSGRIWGLLQRPDGWQAEVLFETDVTISAFGKDALGNIYMVDHRDGEVLRLEAQ
ncbi:MAG: PQQ-dependent sugar dehydrogenase [Anaerolineaceae bacterium]|jgi:glucose/arabinose dehydrogenase